MDQMIYSLEEHKLVSQSPVGMQNIITFERLAKLIEHGDLVKITHIEIVNNGIIYTIANKS